MPSGNGGGRVLASGCRHVAYVATSASLGFTSSDECRQTEQPVTSVQSLALHRRVGFGVEPAMVVVIRGETYLFWRAT